MNRSQTFQPLKERLSDSEKFKKEGESGYEQEKEYDEEEEEGEVHKGIKITVYIIPKSVTGIKNHHRTNSQCL